MFQYYISISPAKPNSTTDYTIPEIMEAFQDACKKSNAGIAFSRDRKSLKIIEVQKQSIVLQLISRKELVNPTRTLSSLSRMLLSMPVYDKYLKYDTYNKVFYNPKVLESYSTTPEELSKEDMLKLLIDMLYSIDPTESLQAKTVKEDTLQEINKLLVNYQNYISIE